MCQGSPLPPDVHRRRSFILAKARGGPDVVRENLAHLRRHLESLFPLAT